MTDKYALESKLSPLLRKILALLAELNESRQGVVFYNHIKQTLEDWEAAQIKTVETYAGLINLLLDAFASQLPPDSVALTHLKLVQTCLTPPLSEAELHLLKVSVEQAADILKHSTHIDAEELNDTLMPLLKRMAGAPVEPDESHFPQPTPKEAKKFRDYVSHEQEAEPPELDEEVAPETEFMETDYQEFMEPEDFTEHDEQEQLAQKQDYFEGMRSAGHGDAGDTKPLKAPKAVLKMLRFPDEFRRDVHDEPEETEELQQAESTSETENLFEDNYPTFDELDAAVADLEDQFPDQLPEGEPEAEPTNYRLKTSDQNEMERLHRDFVRQMRSIVAENSEFGVHLGLEIDALDEATKIQNIEDRRKAILASMKKLSESHTELAKKFDTAQTYLAIIESDKRKLSDELDRARMLSLTDELTGLPNRRAFIRRMDDEVSRVKRYGFPLSLVLIDIDHFKQVNDKYGHAAGDRVLQVYAEKILSIFRHHDMIARYGGEEFAVLLPNTDLEGVLRALDKVKGTVPNVQCKINEFSIPAPTFSAGVTEYRAPESPTQFIERADHALYQAKRMGRNRIEVEQKSHEHGFADHT